MLLGGGIRETVSIVTPKGATFYAEILDVSIGGDSVSCAVRKDGGDDPDVTTGALIYAEVSAVEPPREEADAEAGTEGSGRSRITIYGGDGVGRVTRPGLDQPVGEAAINSVPRRMITEELLEVCRLYDYSGDLRVTISVPGGRDIAEKTFNPRLGIEGGISIIGTSGVVEPMSEQAIVDTIRVELSQRRAEGSDIAFISPGNYGLDFMRETYSADLDLSVKCSNYIGDTVDMISDLGFGGMLLTGHAGKLVKIAGGIMNTHSRMADCRMEIIAAAAAREGADNELLVSILDSLTTDEAFELLAERSLLSRVSARLMDGIVFHLRKRAGIARGAEGGELRIECIMYTKEHGLLASTPGAAEMIAQMGRRSYDKLLTGDRLQEADLNG